MDAKPSEKSANNQPDQVAPVTRPAENKSKEVVQEKPQPSTSHKRGDSCADPLYYRECKEEGWTKEQIIATISTFLGVVAIVISSLSAWQAGKASDTAIEAVEETRKQFAIINEPLLEINTVNIAPLQEGVKHEITVNIRNLGKFPCKIVEMKIAGRLKRTTPNFEDVHKDGVLYTDVVNRYVTDSAPLTEIFATPRNYSREEIDLIATGELGIYNWGYIRYRNIVTDSIKTYNFMLKNSRLGNYMNNEFIINQNTPELQR